MPTGGSTERSPGGRWKRSRSPGLGVSRLLREAAEVYTDPAYPRGCLIISAATNCTQQSADIQATLRRHRNANVAGLERRITADVEAGALPADTDARVLAVFTAAVVQGMSQQARDGASRDELRAVAEAAMRAWPGLGSPPDPAEAGAQSSSHSRE